MTFEQAVAKYSVIQPQTVLAELLDWLKDGKGFCHTRINDGEFLCMFRKRRPDQVNGCTHHYFTDLGDNLLRMLREMKDTVDSCKVFVADHPAQSSMNFRIGSYWFMQSDRRSELDEAATAAVKHLEVNGMFDLPWVGSDDLVKGLPKTLELFDCIRESGRKAILVGHHGISDGRYCLGADFLEIPRYDCWKATGSLFQAVNGICEKHPNAIFLWSCGMSKTWAWDTWRKHPNTSHLDTGHLWDGVFGDLSRAWLRRQDRSEPLWCVYKDVFSPYVLRFIK